MSRRFKLAFIVLVAAQTLLLAGFVAEREFTLRQGDEVVLQTLPIDPRSLLQGDYAILRYEIGELPVGRHRARFSTGDTVYVLLEERGGVWGASGYTANIPQSSDSLFIEGEMVSNSELRFGIENFFVPEGTGGLVEDAIDVKVIVAVDSRGAAVIKDLLLDGVPFDEARQLQEGQ